MQHIIYNHAPCFAKTYGSLSVWSTQGMEKTHYLARTGYFKHTRHGGGKTRANSLLELHQWNYRRLFHRANQKSLLNSSPITRVVRLHTRQRCQARWRESVAKKNLDAWRKTRIRVGRRWVSSSSGPSAPSPQIPPQTEV